MNDTTAKRFWSKVDASAGPFGCWWWLGMKDPDGYGKLKSGGKYGGADRAHRVAYSLEIEKVKRGVVICHACDNPACVNPYHLWVGSHSANATDRHSKKRTSAPVGSKNGSSRLTEEQVVEILMDRGTRERKFFAEKYGIALSTLDTIYAGKTWKHINIKTR